jgi:5-methylcytosine-specific restriction endonuclease McrA
VVGKRQVYGDFEYIPIHCGCPCHKQIKLNKKRYTAYEQYGYPKFIRGHCNVSRGDFCFIPYKCKCDCGNIVPLKKESFAYYERLKYPEFIPGHYININNPSKSTDIKEFESKFGIYPPIFDLCWCNCGEIVYGGKRFVTHHNIKFKHPSEGLHISDKHREKIRLSKIKTFLLKPDGTKEIYPPIFDICHCPDLNCGEIVYGGKEYVVGHQSKSSLNLTDGTWYPSIPDLCWCNCGEIVYNGNRYIKGHICGWNEGLPTEMQPCFGHVHSAEFCKNISERQMKSLNHNWKGGYSKGDYPEEFNDEFRELIRIRDSYLCQNCNKLQEENLIETNRILSVHHIDYNKKNCDPNNLISLCLSCHAKTSSNRRYYEQYFVLFMKERTCQK